MRTWPMSRCPRDAGGAARVPGFRRKALLQGLGRLSPPLIAVLLLALPGLTQQKEKTKSGEGAYVVSVHAPVMEAAHGFLDWIIKHQSAVPWYRESPRAKLAGKPQGTLSHGLAGPEPPARGERSTLPLWLPQMDLYAPSGDSIYYSTTAAKNANFLGTLPAGIRWAKAHKTPVPRPTLKEALSMFVELRPYIPSLSDSKRYTIFALSLIGTPSKAPSGRLRYSERQSKIQDVALEKIERRARQIGVRVISVQLELPNGG